MNKVGFTKDGLVFFLINAQDKDGRPMQLRLTFKPKEAIKLSHDLQRAADEARAQSVGIILPRGLVGVN